MDALAEGLRGVEDSLGHKSFRPLLVQSCQNNIWQTYSARSPFENTHTHTLTHSHTSTFIKGATLSGSWPLIAIWTCHPETIGSPPSPQVRITFRKPEALKRQPFLLLSQSPGIHRITSASEPGRSRDVHGLPTGEGGLRVGCVCAPPHEFEASILRT